MCPVIVADRRARPAGGSASAARYRYARFAVYDMVLPLDSSLGPMRDEKPETDLSYIALRAELDELRRPSARAPFLVEWHKRVALPVAALVFAILGFPLAVRSHRGGRSIALVGSLVILVSYYLLLTTLEGSASATAGARLRGHMDPQRPLRRSRSCLAHPHGQPRAGRRLVNLAPVWRALAAARRAPARPAVRWRRVRWSRANPRTSSTAT